jgi:WD40 repeat protein
VAGLTLISASAAAVPTISLAAPGTQAWASTYGRKDSDYVNAIQVSPDGSRVFVTGYSTEWLGGSSEIATVAYDASTGARVWSRRYDVTGRGGAGEDLEVSLDGSTVYVAGYIGGAHSYDYATVAYDASTGSELWARRYNGPKDGLDVARALAVQPDGSAVFVTGLSQVANSGGGRYVTVAYDGSSGAKLWTRRHHASRDSVSSLGAFGLELSPDGSAVFVTGTTDQGPARGTDYSTLAYDATSGDRRWVTRFSGPMKRDLVTGLAVSPDGSQLFVFGRSASTRGDLDYATVAYDAATGLELWATRFNDAANRDDVAWGIALSPDGSRVFVTGESGAGRGLHGNIVTVAYDALSGGQLWRRRYDTGVHEDDGAGRALGVSPNGAEVYMTGSNCITIAYDVATAARRWVTTFDGGAGGCTVLDVNPDGSFVYAAGSAPGYKGYYGDFLTLALAVT